MGRAFRGAVRSTEGRRGEHLRASEETSGWSLERRWDEGSKLEPVPKGLADSLSSWIWDLHV